MCSSAGFFFSISREEKDTPWFYYAHAYTHIHITLFPNPSPYSPFDGMGGKSFITLAKLKGGKGWNANFHVYRDTKTKPIKPFHPFWKMTLYPLWRTSKSVKGDSSTRQDAFMNSSRSFRENIKDFFKKFFIFLKKSLHAPNIDSFSRNYPSGSQLYKSNNGK